MREGRHPLRITHHAFRFTLASVDTRRGIGYDYPAVNFLDAVKEISTKNIRKEAYLRFYLGLAGNADAVRRAERVMFGPDATEEEIRKGREFLEPRVAPFSREDLDRLSLCHVVLM